MPRNKLPNPMTKLIKKPAPSRIKNFRAHIPICLDKKNFIVKTADSTEELRAALKLRHDVFLDELLKRMGVNIKHNFTKILNLRAGKKYVDTFSCA